MYVWAFKVRKCRLNFLTWLPAADSSVASLSQNDICRKASYGYEKNIQKIYLCQNIID